MKKDLIADICVALIVLLFTYTSLTKLLDIHVFIAQLKVSPLAIIKSQAKVLAWLVPSMEVALVILLTIVSTRHLALFGSLALLCFFEIYIGALLISGLKLPCSCGGVINKLSWKEHLLLNASFILLNIIAIIIYKRQKIAHVRVRQHKEL